MAAREHCQDMNELYGELLDLADEVLRDLGADPVAPIASRVAGRIPLPARTTNACRECGICDELKARAKELAATP